MPYRFLEELTYADVAFEATGKTLEELFEGAANATINSMTDDISKIKAKKAIKISIEAENEEQLLFDFLQELIFYKDAQLMLFSKYKIKIKQVGEKLKLDGELKGEEINLKRHRMIVDVKAVSWHQFSIKKSKTGWEAIVILDV